MMGHTPVCAPFSRLREKVPAKGALRAPVDRDARRLRRALAGRMRVCRAAANIRVGPSLIRHAPHDTLSRLAGEGGARSHPSDKIQRRCAP
jgi:hypothetical protein